MTQHIAVQLPPVSEHSDRPKTFKWLWIVTVGMLSGVGGWFANEQAENATDLRLYSELLKPMLAYNRDYNELRARSMNDDMRRVSFFVHLAVVDGVDLETLLDKAMPTSQVPPNLKKLTSYRLIENEKQGVQYGLFTPENLFLLSQGKAPTVTRGKYKGKEAQVEHIVPKNVVPLMDNLLVNLEWLPQPLNASKSDSITPRALDYARRYYEAKLMAADDLAEVERQARQQIKN